IMDIAQGLRALHSFDPPIGHGNLRGASVMIDEGPRAMLADFGLSKLLESADCEPFSAVGLADDPARWLAPELWQGEGKFTVKADVYAWGMTVLELMTHEAPYREDIHEHNTVFKAARGEHPLQPMEREVIERGLDDELWRFLEQCWLLDYNQRPSIERVIEVLSSRR
ncbi:hypothetical protein JAAARDRAFT_132080, partial [Jaapia argillacea MUCL 33604]